METERSSRRNDTLTAHFYSSSLRIVHQLRGPRRAEEPAHISASHMQTVLARLASLLPLLFPS